MKPSSMKRKEMLGFYLLLGTLHALLLQQLMLFSPQRYLTCSKFLNALLFDWLVLKVGLTEWSFTFIDELKYKSIVSFSFDFHYTVVLAYGSEEQRKTIGKSFLSELEMEWLSCSGWFHKMGKEVKSFWEFSIFVILWTFDCLRLCAFQLFLKKKKSCFGWYILWKALAIYVMPISLKKGPFSVHSCWMWRPCHSFGPWFWCFFGTLPRQYTWHCWRWKASLGCNNVGIWEVRKAKHSV